MMVGMGEQSLGGFKGSAGGGRWGVVVVVAAGHGHH